MHSINVLQGRVLAAVLLGSCLLMSCQKTGNSVRGAADGLRPISVGYIANGTWELKSLFPLFQKEMARAHLTSGYIVPELGSEEAFWQQINKFQVLIVPGNPSGLSAAQAKVFKRYLESGGGIWLFPGWNAATTDDLLKYIFPDIGVQIRSDRGIHDPVTAFDNYWWTRQIAPHEVTKGVACLSFPKVGDYSRTTTRLAAFSSEWEVLVRGEKTVHVSDAPTGHSDGTPPIWKDLGVADPAPPLLAIRQMGKGRLACLPVLPDFVVYNLGNPGFPQVFMKEGDGKQNPSDGFTLTANLIRWLAEPAFAAGILKGYEPDTKAAAFKYPESAPLQPALAEAPPLKWFRGLIGVHSDLSDGKTSVAEYAKTARQLGLSFVVFSDPWELLTDAKLAEFKKQCAAVSDETFRAIHGIQYTDGSGIRWAYMEPKSLPRPEDLEKGSQRVAMDAKFVNDAAPATFRFLRVLLGASRMKPDLRTMWWFHFIPPWEYRDGVLASDNTAEYLKFMGEQRSLIPVAYEDVTTAAQLAVAVNHGVMMVHGDSLAAALKKIMPDIHVPWPALADDQMTVASQGPTIDQFSVVGWNYGGGRVEYTRGAQYLRMAVGASSKAGLAEVTVLDNNGAVYRRFLPGGEKKFFRSWTALLDRQHMFVVRVKDVQGRMAITSPRLAFSNCRGVYFCSDNQNALQNQNCPFFHPNIHEFPGIPPNLFPMFYGWRGWDGMQNQVRQARLQIPTLRVGNELKIGESYERVIETALASYYCNIFKTTTTRILGPSASSENAKLASVRLPIRNTVYADQELRSTIPACRADLEFFWHRPDYTQLSLSHYKGSLALLEGEVRFKQDVTLVGEGVPLAGTYAWGAGMDTIYRYSPGATNEFTVTHPISGVIIETIPPGGFISGGTVVGSPFMANAGKTPFRVHVYPDPKPGCFGSWQIRLAEPGEKVAAGSKLPFRLVTGYLADEDGTAGICRDVATSFNLGGGTGGYPLTLTRGKVLDANFILTLEAEGHEVRFKAGPRKMVLDLPVRVKGLQDQGCMAFYEKRLAHFIFVPSIEGDALFQVAIDDGAEVWVGNPVVCDQPSLRLTLIGADEGKGSVEVHNPTDGELKAKLSSPAGTPLIGGWQAEVSVPAGTSVFCAIPAKAMATKGR